MRTRVAALALAAGLTTAGAAVAQEVNAADPQSVLEAVRAFGHKARLDADDEGFPVVRARVGDINYGIQFYGCDGLANCRQLQLASSFDLEAGLSADFVNTWNEEWVIGRLSVDEAGDPLFTYFLTTEGGLEAENFRAVLQLWTDALMGVVEDVGY